MAVGGQTPNTSAYSLTIGGIEYASWTAAESVYWSESGTDMPSQFQCTVASRERSDKILADYDFTGDTVILQDLDNNRRLWAGFVVNAKRTHGVASVVYYSLRAVSWDALLDRYTIPKWRSTLDGTARTKLILSDRAMVQRIIGSYGYGLTANNTNVANTNADMPRISLTSVTTRDLLQAVADAAAWPASPLARRFYVDFDKQLHYYKNSEGTSAPYKIGDRLYDGSTIIPDYIDYDKDITDAAKGVYVKGSNRYGTGLVMNTSTTVRSVDRMDMIDVPESDSTRALKDIATAYFNRHGAAVIGGTFSVTGYDGWRAGQTVNIHDSAFGLNGDYQIREIQAVPNMGSGVTTYDIAYGALPYRLSHMTGRKSRAAKGADRQGSTDPATTDDGRAQEGGSGGCFVAGTMVDTPEGPKAIETLKAGDAVLSFDQHTLAPGVGRVTDLLVHPNHREPRVIVTLEDGRAVETTVGHRFYDPESDTWEKIGEFLPGQMVQEGRIASMAWPDEGPADVYNLTVFPQHTYTVSGILVHNVKTP